MVLGPAGVSTASIGSISNNGVGWWWGTGRGRQAQGKERGRACRHGTVRNQPRTPGTLA